MINKVEVEIEGTDKNGIFVGSLHLGTGENLSSLILSQGLGFLHSASADQSAHVNSYYTAESRARANKKKVALSFFAWVSSFHR